MINAGRRYWNELTAAYQSSLRISCDDLHLGPLLAGERELLALLPHDLRAWQCLELGCGAAQNSIALARRGACCTALDLAEAQLQAAARLAKQWQVQVDLIQADLDALPLLPQAAFDLVHSVYAMPFAQEPAQVVAAAARLLKSGGIFLASVAHPLSTCEWLQVDDAEDGVFVEDYFLPVPDIREHGADAWSRSQPAPVAEVFRWFTDAGLRVRQLLEPQPLPLPEMSEAEIQRRIPYDSAAWRELYEHNRRIPFVLIIVAEAP